MANIKLRPGDHVTVEYRGRRARAVVGLSRPCVGLVVEAEAGAEPILLVAVQDANGGWWDAPNLGGPLVIERDNEGRDFAREIAETSGIL